MQLLQMICEGIFQLKNVLLFWGNNIDNCDNDNHNDWGDDTASDMYDMLQIQQ